MKSSDSRLGMLLLFVGLRASAISLVAVAFGCCCNFADHYRDLFYMAPQYGGTRGYF